MPRFDAKVVPFLVLTLLPALGIVMLYQAPVRRYVVACERTTRASCILEQSRAGRAQRDLVPLDAGGSAVVRVMPQRRGRARVLLYLETPSRSIFAAEFEGQDAAATAAGAAAQLNGVLRGTTPMSTRIEAVAPPLLRWLSWGALGVMGLLILAGSREASRRPGRGPTLQ